MDDDILFNFQVDQPSLLLLLKTVDFYLEKWPGGKAKEQQDLVQIQTELRKAYLDLKYHET